MRFGSIDKTRFTGSIQWSSLINTDYWSISLESATFGGKSIFSNVWNTESIVDSGTTVLVLTGEVFDAFASHIPIDFSNDQGNFYKKGSCPTDMGDFEFGFNGASGLKVPASQYL